MLKTLLLILPVMLPSWRFFKTIDPSPRVQWAFLEGKDGVPDMWHEFQPRPATITPMQMLVRLFWNAPWNEALFVVSCAERIVQGPTAHSIDEITRRVLYEIETIPLQTTGEKIQFRLVFVSRDGADLSQEILFQSDAIPVTGPVVS